MAYKTFAVGDVLPATTQLRIYWLSNVRYITKDRRIYSDNGNLILVNKTSGGSLYIKDDINASARLIYDYPNDVFITPFTDVNGDHAYIDIDTSTWDINSRTISSVNSTMNNYFGWEDVEPEGFTITFNSNGGSNISDIEEATQLPSELPIPTKARNTFVGWYYDSTLKQKAKPNDAINTNITLYAKWYDSLSAFYTDIANLIREFENSGDNIKVTDFADRLRALLESV